MPTPPTMTAFCSEPGLGAVQPARTGAGPGTEHWTRSAHLGRIYDCRHAAATTWLASGAPLAEVARRLGHTVETLVSTYVGALTGDETLTNERIAAALDATSPSNVGHAA